MGCGASKEEIAAFEAMRDRCAQLELDCADLEQNVITLEKQIVTNEGKSKEQLNLYRFKIEVLSNMLSVEEKKLGATVKRLETLKFAMLTQVWTMFCVIPVLPIYPIYLSSICRISYLKVPLYSVLYMSDEEFLK